MIDVERRAGSGDAEAGLALEVICTASRPQWQRGPLPPEASMPLPLRRELGEGSALVRERLRARLGFLDVELDSTRNQSAAPDWDVATEGSRVRILVVRAREELVAARAARSRLASDDDPA